MTEKERINQRFAKDFNLPINIFRDDMFEYYHELYYGFWPEEEWCSLNKEINEEYGGNMEAWLQHYAEVRDRIIRTLEDSDEYKVFNSMDMACYALPDEYRNLPDRNIYTEDCEGKIFISFDLKKANFQALKYAGVIKEETYEDFIDKFDKSFYFKKSKYTRQVIFGKLNPKRQITIERYLMSSIIQSNAKFFEGLEYCKSAKLVAFKSDEIIYEVDAIITRRVLDEYTERIKSEFGINVRAECITVSRIPIVNHNGNKVPAFARLNVNTCETTLKMVSTTFYPQVWKLWNRMGIEKQDRMFFADDQLAEFIYPLELIEDEDISNK